MANSIWLIALGAAVAAAWLRGLNLNGLIPYGVAAVLPVVITILLWPFVHKEWAKILVMFAWLALAIAACIGIAFVPMAILFLCAPAAAALFQKEIVIEAMVSAALLAAILYYANQMGVLPDSIASQEQAAWSKNAGLMATITMMIAAMFAASRDRGLAIGNEHIESRDNLATKTGVNGGGYTGFDKSEQVLTAIPGTVLHINAQDDVSLLASNGEDILGLSDLSMSETNSMSVSELFTFDRAAQNELRQLLDLAQDENTVVERVIAVRFETDNLSYLNIRIVPLGQGEASLYLDDMSSGDKGDFTRKIAQIIKTDNDAGAGVEGEAVVDKSRTLFFAGVSHELRTPLNAIIGFSDMMRSRLFGPLPSKYAEYADLIHDSGQHMLDLIGDVLDLSKIDAGKYQLTYDEFDLSDVIRSSIKMTRPMADAGAIRLDAEIAIDDDLILQADRRAIRQILLNLISNAVKFTPKGGRVVVGAKKTGETINLTVSDNGVGMKPQELDRIGEPFTQAQSAHISDERGSGLGLSLVKALTDLHHGRFAIASLDGEGTTVDIYLPEKPEETI